MVTAKKIFVTGVHGSGKTTLSKFISDEKNIPFISFDSQNPYSPEKSGYSAESFLAGLPETFVVDAIPFDDDLTWHSFSLYEQNNEIAIICVYCPDRDVLLSRKQDRIISQIGSKSPAIKNISVKNITEWISSPKRVMGTLRRLYAQLKTQTKRLLSHIQKFRSIETQNLKTHQTKRFFGNDRIKSKHLYDFRKFYTSSLTALKRYQNVYFYDTIANKYTTKEVALERLNTDWFPLEDHLYDAPYDVGYQDIEIIDFVGYSKSYQTWENLKNEIEWENKKCIDLGCFHGYFCFKMEDEGAEAIGLERSQMVIETARMINQTRGGNVKFFSWLGGDEIPKCDVVLCLNVLHHFGDRSIQEKAIREIHASTVIFEVNRDQISLIKKYFWINKKIKSHRSNRIILICAKKNNQT